MSLRQLLPTAAALVILVGCTSGSTTKEAATAAAAPEPAATQTEEAVIETGDVTILPDEKLPVVIDFNAVWCPPCQKFGPVFHEVAREYRGRAIFRSVDVDSAPNLAVQFGVSSIPQISVLMPDGRVKTAVGYMSKEQFTSFLDSSL